MSAGIQVARTADEARRLRALAKANGWSHPDADPEYFDTVLAAMPAAVRPHLVALEREGRDPIVVAGRLERTRLEARLGYRAVPSPVVRVLTIVHGGVLGAHSAADHGRVLSALRRALADGEADVLRLLALRTDSPLFGLAGSVSPWWCRDLVVSPQAHWRGAIPDSLQEFLAARSRNTRQNVRRYGRRFEREHRNRLRVRRFGGDGESDPERLFADLEAVASRTYQRGLGVGYTGDELQRRAIELDLHRGRYSAWVLDIDGRPRAFWDGSAHAGTFFIGSPGYDPALASARVGTWLFMRMVEDLCADPAISALDYGMGDAQYKRSFGDERWNDAIVHVFAPSFTGVFANAVYTGARGATRLARRALAGTRIEPAIKRAWRAHARAG